MLAYALGQLVVIGVNNPKKFPKPDEFLESRERRVLKDPLQAQQAIRSMFAKKAR